jgi:hypothetical protein
MPNARPTITLDRLGALLEAYGAAPERWPDAERDDARRLVEESAAARTLWEDAAHLDGLLDAVPAAQPSPELVVRVLAAAPRRRPTRVWRGVLAAAVPLAAAAAVVLWIRTERVPATPVAASIPAVTVGEYESPTDVLLGGYTMDVSAAVPSVGCTDSTLGCPRVEGATDPYSRRKAPRRSLA